jgi:hypothetical protein
MPLGVTPSFLNTYRPLSLTTALDIVFSVLLSVQDMKRMKKMRRTV